MSGKHWRIERTEWDDGTLTWDVDLYRDGEFVGGICHDTFAEAVEGFNDWAAEEASQ